MGVEASGMAQTEGHCHMIDDYPVRSRAYLLGYTLLCLALGLALVAVVYLGTRP